MHASNALKDTFDIQKQAFNAEPFPSYPARIALLQELKKQLYAFRQDLAKAVSLDFGHRSTHETLLLEIFPSVQSIHHTCRNLARWMKPEKRKVAWWFAPGRAEVLYQPLGVVGIIVPWNYPIYLAIGPLVGGLSAGNRVILKLSEYTPHTAEVLEQLLIKCFPQEWVSVVTGGPEVGSAFAALPFDHLLFTGSTRVGLEVMKTASLNLTPVTLELGGKSPAIIGEDYPLHQAVERILVGKLLNAGQTCVAPDTVFVPEALLPAFIESAKRLVGQRYPSLRTTKDYTAIVSEKHFLRLQALLEEAKRYGAEIVPLAAGDFEAAFKLPPILVTRVTDDMRLMQEEIFGPILPVLTYQHVEEVIQYIQNHPRPLALYYFDRNKQRIQYVLMHTHSGGVTVNDTVLHVAQDDLPFGGVGASGMGYYHGKEGFETFSKKKAVFYQSRWSLTCLFYPPYTKIKEWMMEWMLRV
ncbi:MAG: coniferyl aldehyde dehydrogenase [Gammaproteobacteria bacterium]|nr:coniferyl aldehyde dehydrogenase [Gammaproteobacteria bacterium]